MSCKKRIKANGSIVRFELQIEKEVSLYEIGKKLERTCVWKDIEDNEITSYMFVHQGKLSIFLCCFLFQM